MKKFWHLLAIGILLLGTAQTARAQLLDTVDPLTNNVPSADAVPGAFSTSFQPADWLPGRFWLELNLADNGLGYTGSFGTLGGKSRLWQDGLDGRWLGEANVNISLDTGGVFYNLGIERHYSIDAANADVFMGFWFDGDHDEQGDFGHTFYQAAVNGGIKSQMFDLIGNGYFPVGTTDYSLGDPTGVNCFLNNNIVLQHGIDSALQGFDATLFYRPEVFAMYGGDFRLGGYQYSSDLVESFAGVRVGTSFRAINSMVVTGEVTYDDRFDTTGVIQLGWSYGGRGGDQDYSTTGNDLNKSRRQSHVSRVQQDLVLAINPVTGLPYHVVHVDNSVAAGGSGTFESRLDTLKDAEAVSSADDIIFVHNGDNMSTNQDQGIVLQTRQQLLGDGVQHIIQTQFGGFVLCNDVDGQRATITNDGGAAVTLASGNVVRGLIIDGTGVNMLNGIQGQGGVGQLRNGTIENNIIRAATNNGIFLDVIGGDWSIIDNVVNTSGLDGVRITRALDANSQFFFSGNNSSTNGRDGIFFDDYDGTSFIFVDNTTNGNTRHGINMINYNSGTGDAAWDFFRPISSGNGGSGIRIEDADGNFLFRDVTIVNNTGSGIDLLNVRTTQAADGVFVGVTNNVSNTISGNGIGAGAGIQSIINAGVQDILVQNTLLNTNGIGFSARANNVGTVQNIRLLNNSAISANTSDGIRIISDAGATSNLTVAQANGVLNMAGNGLGGGNGIALLAQDGGAFTSTINANISNVNITGTGAGVVDSGIFGLVDNNGLLNATLTDINIAGTTGDGMFFDLDSSNNAISNITINRATVSGTAFDGLRFDLTQTQFADVLVRNTTVTGAGGNGITYSANGADPAGLVFPIIPSRSRFNLEGSTITGSGGSGIDVAALGQAEMLLNINGNTSTGNALTGLNVQSGARSLTEVARISARIDNNNFSTNGTFGAFLQTTNDVGGNDGGNLDVLLSNNSIANNDTTITVGEDFEARNSSLGRICIAMTTNSFVLPAVLRNAGAAVDYRVELDGTTNGVGQPTLIGAFTPTPFDTVCRPTIEGQEAVFVGLGF